MWHEVFDVWYETTFESLDEHIRSCPEELWLAGMWEIAKDPAKPRALGPDGAPHPLGNEVLSAVWKVVWHGLAANDSNLNGRRPDFQTRFRPASPAGWSGHVVTAEALDPSLQEGGEVVPIDPPSREELLAYLDHNRALVKRRLDAACEVGEGQSTIGNWTGPTAVLLSMFHGNACHLVSHTTEVGMFVHQHR